ncbi:MAG: hypothetical protein ACI86M_000722 [Saprospiraceae bacterium]|jgi:hypothetical protein
MIKKDISYHEYNIKYSDKIHKNHEAMLEKRSLKYWDVKLPIYSHKRKDILQYKKHEEVPQKTFQIDYKSKCDAIRI